MDGFWGGVKWELCEGGSGLAVFGGLDDEDAGFLGGVFDRFLPVGVFLACDVVEESASSFWVVEDGLELGLGGG